jgi:hypothetical protein
MLSLVGAGDSIARLAGELRLRARVDFFLGVPLMVVSP